MSKYSQTKRLRLIAEKNSKKTGIKLMNNENLKQQYGNKCAELGHAIVQSRLLGTKIETLFTELSKLQEQASIPATPETPSTNPTPVVEVSLATTSAQSTIPSEPIPVAG